MYVWIKKKKKSNVTICVLMVSLFYFYLLGLIIPNSLDCCQLIVMIYIKPLVIIVWKPWEIKWQLMWPLPWPFSLQMTVLFLLSTQTCTIGPLGDVQSLVPYKKDCLLWAEKDLFSKLLGRNFYPKKKCWEWSDLTQRQQKPGKSNATYP